MEKKLLKNLLKNAGVIVVLVIIGIIGINFSNSSDLEVTKQYGNTIYAGKDYLTFAIPALCLAGSLYFVFQEFKLLLQYFSNGGVKAKTGCILLVIIPLALLILLISMIESDERDRQKLHHPTETAMAKLYDVKINGVYKIGTDIGPGWWNYIRPSAVEDHVDEFCHWVIIASDGHEIHPFNEASQPVPLLDSREGTRSAVNNGTEIPVEIKPDDKEFRNIDCGEFHYDDFQGHH